MKKYNPVGERLRLCVFIFQDELLYRRPTSTLSKASIFRSLLSTNQDPPAFQFLSFGQDFSPSTMKLNCTSVSH